MENIKKILDATQFLGDRYAVGGCVRDYLLGLEPQDIDLAVKTHPYQIISQCYQRNIPAKLTGDAHGTVTILIGDENIEVTTFRKDVSTDGRRATVEFAETIYDDLERRDFSINAIALAPNGALVDPHHGAEDLHNGILNTVGNPYDRFQEDYLRIIRGARFAARFNLEIDKELDQAAFDLSSNIIKHVSIERIVNEFTKAFYQCEYPSSFLDILYHWTALFDILPELQEMPYLKQHPLYHPEGDVWAHTLQVVDNSPSKYRWHALLHDVGKPKTAKKGTFFCSFHGHESVGAEMVPDIAKRLKFSNDMTNELITTTEMHMYPLQIYRNITENAEKIPERIIRRFQLGCGQHLTAVKEVVKADRMNRLGPTEEFIDKLFEPLPEQIKPVLLGRHLIEAGYKPSNLFTPMLKKAFNYQIDAGCMDKNKLLEVATSV